MNRRIVSLGMAFVVAGLLMLAGTAEGKDLKKKDTKGPEKKTSAPDSQEMDEAMAAWAKYAAPGVHHAHLKPMAGSWSYTGKWRMAPEAPWTELSGTADVEWVLGGRFLMQKALSEPMMEGGDPFEGIGFLGYDNYKKKYTSIWMDSMGTMTFTAEGTCNDNGKVITFVGQYDDPTTGSTKKAKGVYKIESDYKHVLEWYEQGAGDEYKTMEIAYTRKN